MNRGAYVTGCAIAVAILTTAACSSTPETTYVGDPIVGRQVAQDLCSSCHSIETIGASPNPGAPPLRYVLAGYEPERLARDFDDAVSISHLKMPTFYFDHEHPYDLVAYLETIQQPLPAQSGPNSGDLLETPLVGGQDQSARLMT